MDSYQAIYDAASARLGRTDVGSHIDSAVRDCISGIAYEAVTAWRVAAEERSRPCVLYRPSLTIDGDKWCALYGVNIQDGVAGFGASPDEAMRAFDAAWCAKIDARAAKGGDHG